MTVEQFARLITEMEEAKAAYMQLVEAGMCYETARVLLCNRHQMTMGRATDTIELLQTATSCRLPGAPDVTHVARSQIN
jgi:adenosylcobinamide amidohydrolase